ncbi:MAG: bifunctional oligoribonuclease/PAP phosphatase NrnA [Flavobacteriales bacterium]|nr:bifunctional oligoribonuclease/PAP phosphatase NrnA [Flavobacteriales bacterium]MCB9448217.1 bifunctional oligoribonuclease/PAP phosphatase NrnA [Flavobacteriales bacterium]
MNYKQLKSLLADPRKIVITTHTHPDGDAMGSSLALALYLQKKGHRVQVITPTGYPDFLHWLPGNNEVLIYNMNDGTKRKGERMVGQADIVFALDYNDPKRIDDLGKFMQDSKATKVLVDHHPDPVNFAELALSDTRASSTCELIHRLITSLGDKALVNQDIASCLYTGIMTDTGSFRFASTSPETHRVVASLIETGMQHTLIHERIFDSYSESRARLLGYSLKDKLVVFPEFHAAYISLSKAELDQFGYQNGDTEGLVNYAYAISGIRLGALFMEKGDLVKISFRSKGSFDVNELAREHFSGGGHKNAAGGSSTLTLQETVKKFEALLPSYAEGLKAF